MSFTLPRTALTTAFHSATDRPPGQRPCSSCFSCGQNPKGSENVTGSPPAKPYRLSPPPIPIGSSCVNRPLAGSKNLLRRYTRPASPCPFAGRLPIHVTSWPTLGLLPFLRYTPWPAGHATLTPAPNSKSAGVPVLQLDASASPRQL